MLLIYDKKSLKIDIKDIWVFIGTGLIATLPSSVFYNESLLNVSLSLAALLLGLSPVFALIISVVLFKEKLTSRKIFCLVIALIGCLFVSGVLETSGFKWSGWGIIAGLLSALTWAIYGVFSKIAIKKNYSTLTILFYNFFICSVFLIPFTQWDLFITYTWFTSSDIWKFDNRATATEYTCQITVYGKSPNAIDKAVETLTKILLDNGYSKSGGGRLIPSGEKTHLGWTNDYYYIVKE